MLVLYDIIMRFVDRKLPLTTMVRLNVFQHCVLSFWFISRWYETLALSGLRFVDRKLPLTTMVRLNVFQHCVLSFWFISRWYETLALSGLRFVDGKLPLTTMVRLNIFQPCVFIILVGLVVARHCQCMALFREKAVLTDIICIL